MIGRRVLGLCAAAALAVSLEAGTARAQGSPLPTAGPPAVQAAGKAFVRSLGRRASACKGRLHSVDAAAFRSLASCLFASAKAAAREALVVLARGLFDELIAKLRAGDARAREAFAAFVDRIASVVPEVGALARPLAEKVGAASRAFVNEAARCRSRIVWISPASARDVVQCLKSALRL
jgi:hypothetical protein